MNFNSKSMSKKADSPSRRLSRTTR